MGELCCYCETELLPSDTTVPIVRNNSSFNLHKADVVKHPKAKTKEHLIPKHLGGTDTLPCCYKCNSEKHRLTLSKYLIFLSDRPSPENAVKIKNVQKLIIRYAL